MTNDLKLNVSLDLTKLKNFDWFSFGLFFFVGILFYGNYTFTTFGSETYDAYVSDFGRNVRWMLFYDPRPMLALFARICYLIGFNPTHNQRIVIFLAILIQTISCFIGYKAILKRIAPTISQLGKVLLIFASIIVWFNPFFTDNLQWAEWVLFFFIGNLCAVISAVIISENNNQKQLKNIIVACLLLLVTINTYQAGLYFFVLYSMIFYFMDSLKDRTSGIKYWLSHLLKLVFVYVVTIVFMVLYLRLFSAVDGYRGMGSFAAGFQNIVFNLQHLLRNYMPFLWSSAYGMLPNYLFSLAFLSATLMLFIGLYWFIKQEKTISKKLTFLFVSLCAIIGPIIALFAPALISPWPQPAMIVGFFSLLSLVIFLCVALFASYVDIFSHRLAFGFKLILLVISSGIIIQSWAVTNSIQRRLVITNAIELANAKFYLEAIRVHEANTGIIIKNIAFTKDESFTYKLPDARFAPFRINERGFHRLVVHTNRSFLIFMGGGHLNLIPMPEDIRDRYFAGRNWDSLSPEQIVFIGDTVFISLY